MRISIITPSFQQAPYLDECLRSVATQDHPDVEHIVVDGGSTDGSVAIIERHAARLAWWCSEKDAGQSDALNKGLQHATGDIFGWLNSDDLLLPGALREVAAVFANDPNVVVVTGRRRKRHANGTEEVMPMEAIADERSWFVRPQVNQQATFYRTDILRAWGGVDPTLHYVMDLELWWRLLFEHGTSGVRVVDREWAVFRMHEASKSASVMGSFVAETAALLQRACLDVGAIELARTLSLGHDLRHTFRPLPVGAGNRELVERMTVHFLLKWYRSCHDRSSYRMMRALYTRTKEVLPLVEEVDHRYWLEMQQNMVPPGWWAFLLYRKWKHVSA
jgi:glycosyltransferase involved in cell wall biosynthesis